MNKPVEHITMFRKKVNWNTLGICIPQTLYNDLGMPNSIVIHENPIRFVLPTINSMKTYKVSRNLSNNSCDSSYTPISHYSEYVGKYSYEIEDCTVYLTKIEDNN